VLRTRAEYLQLQSDFARKSSRLRLHLQYGCIIRDLQEADTVLVQRNADGTFAILSIDNVERNVVLVSGFQPPEYVQKFLARIATRSHAHAQCSLVARSAADRECIRDGRARAVRNRSGPGHHVHSVDVQYMAPSILPNTRTHSRPLSNLSNPADAHWLPSYSRLCRSAGAAVCGCWCWCCDTLSTRPCCVWR
jgi:hypothetical protein